MNQQALSIRPFVGAKDYDQSRRFYRALGFEEREVGAGLTLFRTEQIAFYLQDAYVPEWIENTMVFVEVASVEAQWAALRALDLPGQFPGTKLTPIRTYDWGRECFLHDPSGVLWHFGEFVR